jgi:hypothetical protein
VQNGAAPDFASLHPGYGFAAENLVEEVFDQAERLATPGRKNVGRPAALKPADESLSCVLTLLWMRFTKGGKGAWCYLRYPVREVVRGNALKLSRSIIVVTAVVTIAMIGLAAAWQGLGHGRGPVTFDPPYPERDAAGSSILAVFDGRIPCFVVNCERRKVTLVMYHDHATTGPSMYWLGIVGLLGNEREVVRGTWGIRRGVEEYPDAEVYALDGQAPVDLRYYWRLTQDILLPLDQSMRPMAGNAAWGFMLRVCPETLDGITKFPKHEAD